VTAAWVVGLSLALACAPRPAPPAEVATGRTVVGPVVSLERTPCFGKCPSYKVSVSSSGVVAYEGRADVRRVGTDTARIPVQRVEALLLELERAGYFTFADRYAPSEPTCRRPSTDSPSVLSSATFRGRTKRIEHYYGCDGVPGSLTLLEQRIDEVLGSARWTGR
jgi:Domain of unknown function (DUF6438)